LCFNEWRVRGYGTTLVGVGWRKEGEIKERSGKGEEGNDKQAGNRERNMYYHT
jgi:hypothetical protein